MHERDLMLSSTPCSSQDSLSDNLNVVTNDFVSEAQTTTSRKESSDEYRLHHKCCALTLLRHSISATGIAASTATTTAMLNHRHRQHGGAVSSSCVCGGAGNQFNNGTRRQTADGVCAHYEGELGDYGKINKNDSDGVDAIRRKGKAINHFSRFKKSLRQRARALAINASNRRTSAPPTSPLVQPEHVIPTIFRRFSRRGPLFLRASIISMSASGGALPKPRLRCCDDGTATRDNNGKLDALRHEAALLRRRSESQSATMIVARPPLNRHHHPHHHHYHHYTGHHVVPIGAGSTEAALSAASRHKSCRTDFQKWRPFSADLSDYVPPPCKELADDNRFNHHHTTLSNAHNNPSEMDARTNAFPDAGNALIRRMVNNSLCIGNYRSGGGGQKLPRGDVTRRTTESSDAERFNYDQQQPPQYHHYQRAAATKFAPLFEEDVVSIADASDVIGPVAPPLPPRMVGICGGGTFDLVIQNAGAHSTIHEEKQKFGDCCPPTVVSVSSNVGNMIPMIAEKYERQQPPPSVKFNFMGDASQTMRLPPPPLRRGSSAVEFSSECLTRNSAETSTTNITSSMSSNNHFSESSVSKARVAADASTLSSNNSVTQKQHSTDTLSCSSTGGRSLAAEARRRLLTAERNASPTRLATDAHGDSSNAAVKTLVKKTTINRKESKSSLKRKVTKSQRKEKRATKTLGIVVGIFLICWVPFFSINIINAVCTTIQQPSCEIGFGPFFYSTWIGYMNSFMNPIIYTIFNTEFRRAFKSLILGKNAVKRQQRQVRERRMV